MTGKSGAFFFFSCATLSAFDSGLADEAPRAGITIVQLVNNDAGIAVTGRSRIGHGIL